MSSEKHEVRDPTYLTPDEMLQRRRDIFAEDLRSEWLHLVRWALLKDIERAPAVSKRAIADACETSDLILAEYQKRFEPPAGAK